MFHVSELPSLECLGVSLWSLQKLQPSLTTKFKYGRLYGVEGPVLCLLKCCLLDLIFWSIGSLASEQALKTFFVRGWGGKRAGQAFYYMPLVAKDIFLDPYDLLNRYMKYIVLKYILTFCKLILHLHVCCVTSIFNICLICCWFYPLINVIYPFLVCLCAPLTL